MKAIIFILMAGLFSVCAGCRTNRPPDHMMIEMAFFKCDKCRSLEGGIYGKGPFKSLHTAKAATCIHSWQKVSRNEFMDLATQWQGVDWSNEIPFWTKDR